MKLERDTKQQLRLKHQKKIYEEAVSEALKDNETVKKEEEPVKAPRKRKQKENKKKGN